MKRKSDLFRQHHFFELLRSFDPSKGPIDLFISLYFRHHPQLGSKDRVFIVDRIYKFFRWKALVEAILPQNVSDDDFLTLLEQDFSIYEHNADLPIYVRLSFPKELFDAIERSWGEKTCAICRACNETAPIVLRANMMKTTPEELVLLLQARNIDASKDPSHPTAIRVQKRTNFFSLEEFQNGLFEVQDAGSQHVASYVAARPGDAVLDFCAGAGGKSLAIAPSLQRRGQVFLHDIRSTALQEAKKRLRRAGVQNVQLIEAHDTKRLELLRGKMDWVLVDAPCSGTGTLRRNPDMKWKFSMDTVQRLVEEQRRIVAQAVSYLMPHGTLVYATCSLLREENEDQVEFFQQHLHVHPTKDPFRSYPTNGGMDGFYAIALSRS